LFPLQHQTGVDLQKALAGFRAAPSPGLDLGQPHSGAADPPALPGRVSDHQRVIGHGAYVGSGVRIGANCKLQNHALVYEPAVLEDGVFIGPAAVLTNDQYPRAVTPDGRLKTGADWHPVGVTVRRGASVGARAVCVAPVTVGAWALVAAGAVVTQDVPDHALVVGAPARRVGWVGRAGVPLQASRSGTWRCPETGETYTEHAGVLRRDHLDGTSNSEDDDE